MSDDVQVRRVRPTEGPPRPANGFVEMADGFVEMAAAPRESMIVLDDDEVDRPAPPIEALVALFRRPAHERGGQSA